MTSLSDVVDTKSCRICLSNKKVMCPLFRYKLSGNYAEMLTAIADVKVASNDGLPEKICTKCCLALERAFLLKTVAERSDRKLRKLLVKANENIPTKKIAFDTFTDIKTEIGPLVVKCEPKWEMEIEVGDTAVSNQSQFPEVRDIVIANTVIRKVDGNSEESKKKDTDVNVTWSKTTDDDTFDSEYLDEDVFHGDDDNDADYVPPEEHLKTKFKKPKLSEIKVFKGKKPVVRKIRVLKKLMQEIEESQEDDGSGSTTITCYPIMKNGSRGPAVLLKRPKDSTILKLRPGYKSKPGDRVRMVKAVKPIVKPREKLVCPVCGILTYTLGNHMATHQDKKKYSCPECPRSFMQNSNLLIHMKQHTGIRDHICEVCGAGFYSQKSLVRHNLIHKGERPFSCDLCPKKFIARCDLNRHLRIHSGYKPFKCATCTMSFNAKHQLQNHERMHTGERPYTCQVCNVAFSYKVNLNNHVLKVHGINLKFKSIHTVTEDILRREMSMVNEARVAISHIMPQLPEVPSASAHETVTVHTNSDY